MGGVKARPVSVEKGKCLAGVACGVANLACGKRKTGDFGGCGALWQVRKMPFNSVKDTRLESFVLSFGSRGQDCGIGRRLGEGGANMIFSKLPIASVISSSKRPR